MFQQLLFQLFYTIPDENLVATFEYHCNQMATRGVGPDKYEQLLPYLMVTEALYAKGLSPDTWKPMFPPN
jgi:hypothetical protein